MHGRAVAAVALLGIVVLTAVGVLVARNRPAPPGPSPTPTAAPTTLLVQVRDERLLASGSLLMGLRTEGDVQHLDQMFWTEQWWVDQKGPLEISAADLGRQPLPYVMDTISAQTSVAVTDAWVLDRLALAGLIDAVGGVRLRFEQPVVYETQSGDRVLVPAGVRTITGASAADYIMDPSLVDPDARYERFRAVWNQVLRQFPTDQERARTLVISLGALSKATMPNEDLADLLQHAHEALVTNHESNLVLPLDMSDSVRVSPPQGVRRAYALDYERASGPVGLLFLGFPEPAGPTVRMYAAAPRAADVRDTRERLSEAGWETAWGGTWGGLTAAARAERSLSAEAAASLQEIVGVTPVRGLVIMADAEVGMPKVRVPTG